MDASRTPALQAAAALDADLDAGGGVEVELAYRLPYDVDALLGFIATRAVPEVEQVDGRAIRRSVRAGALAPVAGWLEVRFDDTRPRLRLRYAAALAPASIRVIAAVRRWLDLDAMPLVVDAALTGGRWPLPGAPGLRLPGGPDAFELAARAILGQQVTVLAARTIARRLADRFGEPLATPWPAISHCFPSPAVLAAAGAADIAATGIIRSRAGAIAALAADWGRIAPLIEGCAPACALPLTTALRALPGIGPWTAEYIAMRALGWSDAFPPNDVAVRKAMNRLFGTASPREADAQAQGWRPWRSYAVLRLWNSLATPPADTPATVRTTRDAAAPHPGARS